MVGGQEEKSLRDLALDRVARLRDEQEAAAGLARRHQKWHYGIGVPGAVTGAAGSVSFFFESFPTVASWVALVGGTLTGLGGFLGENNLAKLHWRRHDCLGALVQEMENALASGREPTREELDGFARAWQRCTGGDQSA